MTMQQQAVSELRELRVLLMTPTGEDGAIATDILARVGIVAHPCCDMAALVHELDGGAGAVLLSEEAVGDMVPSGLAGFLKMQPPWSDLPLLVLACQGADSGAIVGVMEVVANVTVLERPMRAASLVSALRSALRGRRCQYELRNQLDRLRQADECKTEFLATLAHELRNPMAPLRMTLAILKRFSPGPEDAKRHYALMGRQLDHMARLVDDLMEVSRITRGKIELRLELLTLEQVVQDALELSRPLLEAGAHQVVVTTEQGGSLIRGDRVRLAQVFANLLNNAAKYTPNGGRVELVTRGEGNHVAVVVRDNGNGIAPDMLPRIFDMFVQVSGTARAAQGGLGIGLTLVKSLVELHGGSVRVSSEGLGHGTEVVVSLPLARARSPGHAQGDQDSPADRFTGCVLVVDDNRDSADSLAELLRLSGAQAVVAYNGPDALKLAARVHPALGILDIGMPGMDGCELAQRLLADPAHQGLRLVAMTGWGQENDRARVASAGFMHHLLKPIDIAELTSVLGDQLARTGDANR